MRPACSRRVRRAGSTRKPSRQPLISILRGLAASDFGMVSVSTPSVSSPCTASAFTSPGSQARNSNRPVRRVLRCAAASVLAVLLLLLLGDLAADDQFPVLQLYVDLVLADPGQLYLRYVGVLGLGQVGQRDPGHLDPGHVAEREVHQLAHAVVDVLELARGVDEGRVPPAAADRERCHVDASCG